jgi:hypothetical protein
MYPGGPPSFAAFAVFARALFFVNTDPHSNDSVRVSWHDAERD